MRIIIRNASGFGGEKEEFSSIMDTLRNAVLPPPKKEDTEYVLRIADGSVCIFRVKIGREPKMIQGSMLVQIGAGSLKIGFVDIHDEDIENSIRKTIDGHWRLVREEADRECST